MKNKTCACLQCKKEGKNPHPLYSETLNKTVVVQICDEHFAIFKKAGVNPRFDNHPEIKWQQTVDVIKKQTPSKDQIPQNLEGDEDYESE